MYQLLLIHSDQVTFQTSTIHYITCRGLDRIVDRGRNSASRQRHTGSTRAANVITTLCISATVPDASTSTFCFRPVVVVVDVVERKLKLSFANYILSDRSTDDRQRAAEERKRRQSTRNVITRSALHGRRRHVRFVIEEFFPAQPPASLRSVGCRIVCWYIVCCLSYGLLTLVTRWQNNLFVVIVIAHL